MRRSIGSAYVTQGSTVAYTYEFRSLASAIGPSSRFLTAPPARHAAARAVPEVGVGQGLYALSTGPLSA